jgi:hypothetical protein
MTAAIQEAMKWHSNIQSWATTLIARADQGHAVSKPDLKMAKKIMGLQVYVAPAESTAKAEVNADLAARLEAAIAKTKGETP